MLKLYEKSQNESFLHFFSCFSKCSIYRPFLKVFVPGNLNVDHMTISFLFMFPCLWCSWWWQRTPGWGLRSSQPLNNCSCHTWLKWIRPSCPVWPPSTGPPWTSRNTWTESLLHSVRLSSWKSLQKKHVGHGEIKFKCPWKIFPRLL